MRTTVPRDELLKIVYGEHADPFSVLGYHEIHDNGRSEFSIRVFVPDAQTISIVLHEYKKEMTRIHQGGFFELVFDHPLGDLRYLVEVHTLNGNIRTFHDPYSFGTIMSQFDLHLIGEGTLDIPYEKLGAHPVTIGEVPGVYFATWAPNARRVSVAGDFNNWNGRHHPMRKLSPSGIWELFIPDIGVGTHYKFEVMFQTRHILMKADPYALASELRPRCASIVTDRHKYSWGDNRWLEERKKHSYFNEPLNIYEVHLGSWLQSEEVDEESDAPFLNYRELAHKLVDYVKDLGYTHIELMPVMEHLLDASWGYQVTGYYAPTSRFGTPDDFRYFVDHCHRHNIGVIMDWVPAHFPRDYTALARFDGSALYEHLDPRKGFHPHWGTYIFNYERNEVRNFLISSAIFWIKEYHLDGLRVDAVASMLYLDYGREGGDWVPNKYGGRENLEAIAFIRELNERLHQQFPDVIMIAEESTAWPMVTKPVYSGGLGFDYKWNMGWMNDFLKYMSSDPIYRKHNHNLLTWTLVYSFAENYILPLSHDEVVHLKKSMLDKMPGDVWKKMSNLRLTYGYQMGHPGKKLLFMGGEFGQWREWTEKRSLDWELLQRPEHQKLLEFVKALNHFYRSQPALWDRDLEGGSFEWIDFADVDRSIICFIRHSRKKEEDLYFAFNFTPVPRHDYRIGVPDPGTYREIFNSDDKRFGGSGLLNGGEIRTEPISWHKHYHSFLITMPPLGFIVLKKKQ